jgi:hypothetical protein
MSQFPLVHEKAQVALEWQVQLPLRHSAWQFEPE